MNEADTDIILTIKRLRAENESLKEQLKTLEELLSDKNRQIILLEEKNSEASGLKSNFDNQADEMGILHSHILHLKQQIESSGTRYRELEGETGQLTVMKDQLSIIEGKYCHVQSQLKDLQQQIQILEERNILLRQKNNGLTEFRSNTESC